MKKLIFCVAVIALAGSIFGLTRTNQNEGFSDIQLANIEALAQDEAQGYMYVTKRNYDGIPGCACAGRGNKICCDDPLFPGYDQ